MLARIRKAKEEREGGFTLIELLVVIIIIGILAAIAIPVFLNQRQKGYDAQAKADARNLATLEETYMTENNFYNPEADAATAATDLGYKKSSNVNAVSIVTYAVGTPPTSQSGALTSGQTGVGSFCVDVTSASTKHFYYNSLTGGLTTTACPA